MFPHCPRRELNLGRPSRSLMSVLTEVPQRETKQNVYCGVTRSDLILKHVDYEYAIFSIEWKPG